VAVLLIVVAFAVLENRTVTTQTSLPEANLLPLSDDYRVTTISSSGRWLVVSDHEDHLSLMDLRSPTTGLRKMTGVVSPVLAVLSTISGEDTEFVSLRKGRILIEGTRPGIVPKQLPIGDLKGQIETIEFSPEGQSLAIATDVGEVALQRTDGSSPPRKIGDFDDPSILGQLGSHIDALAFSPSGDRVAAASILSATVVIYDVATIDRASAQRILTDSSADGFFPHRLAFDSHGRRLATGDVRGGIVRVWNIETRTVEQQFRASIDNVASLSFDANSNWLASVAEEGRLTLLDINAKRARSLYPAAATAGLVGLFFGQTLYSNLQLAPAAQPGLLVRVSDNTGGIPNVDCALDGKNFKSSDNTGVCFFPNLQGTHELQVGPEKRIVSISTPVVVAIRVPSSPQEWQLPGKN